ncbi:Anthranilate N-methyltransferase [Morus notabilis]|uniref:caffeate O-methyltransferase n=1 Tax=Morus notabilis TaxID=981085 RepID=W9RLE6_9ROSA|nr:caffeic acid 3-O-methyltransferase [Morus notabilis]EXB83827.1 Anthranilate N-methyltransferase [Morus notabilis]
MENNPNVLNDVYRREEEENYSFAMQLATAPALSMSLHAAIELGVFDIIAKAGEGAKLSPAEIVEQLAANNPEAPIMLDRILRMLASHSILSCSVVGDGSSEPKFRRLYGLRPVSKYFVTNEYDGSFGPMLALVHDKILMDSWFQLKDAILEGGVPFKRVHGTHSFEYLGLDQRLNQLFNKAMDNASTIIVKKLLKYYKGFNHLQKLVDVGGGLGVTLNLITSKFPHVKGINFDLPHVVEHAPSYPGVEHVGGDMFDKVPIGDAILLKSVLHDWNDEHCLKLLKNCSEAIPTNGKVIVVDVIFPVKPETSSHAKSNSQLDVLVMAEHQLGAKERSREEFLALATGAGFREIKFEYFMGDYWIMEFFK